MYPVERWIFARDFCGFLCSRGGRRLADRFLKFGQQKAFPFKLENWRSCFVWKWRVLVERAIVFSLTMNNNRTCYVKWSPLWKVTQSRGTFKLMNYHSAYHLPDIGFWEKVDRFTHCSDPSRISIMQCASVCQRKPAEESSFYETLLNRTLHGCFRRLNCASFWRPYGLPSD